MTRRDAAAAICAGVLFSAGLAAAQDGSEPGGLTRQIELRAHEALMARIAETDTGLSPFVTDGCSGGLSDIWKLVSGQFPDFAAAHNDLPPWEDCCVAHDRVYHDAGKATSAADSYAARLLADEELRLCVIRTGGTRKDDVAAYYDVDPARVMNAYQVIADAMKLAVRFGGAPCSGLSWRWGYGYPDCSILNWSTKE
ncbi:hypothetical protein QO034_03955 [Sedimentitalea sp. JM2-8]|uniref:Phospholipase A2 n=1 Tax=Sedimentitalea xiamensis TaxID=3050037 RepID=A0ABT7FAZ4_9RHOB|nr:hypothetical protein [Sedimentitalea xiamensis]MDK3072255.1 hypothetical protein [Sedimentitalea xiamensis]